MLLQHIFQNGNIVLPWLLGTLIECDRKVAIVCNYHRFLRAGGKRVELVIIRFTITCAFIPVPIHGISSIHFDHITIDRTRRTITLCAHHIKCVCFEQIPILNRDPTTDFHEMHIICLDTKDNPTEATLSGQVCLDLCWRLQQSCRSAGGSDGLAEEVATIIDQFQQERASVTPIKVLYQLCYL